MAITIVAAGWSIAWASAAEGQTNYFIEGTISVANAPFVKSNTMPFSVMVNGCRWSIELLANPALTTNIHSFRQDFDGTNLISLVTYKGFGSGRNDSSGKVEFNKVPNGISGSHIGKIWIAYASHCYFIQLTNSRAEPIWFVFPEERDRHFTIPAKWKLTDEPPGLPEGVEYFDDGLIRSQPPAPASSRKPPFNKGYLAASFSVDSWTNFGRLRLPSSFTYRHFVPKQDANTTNDTELSSIAVAQLIKIRGLDESDKWPSLEANSPFLEDRRVASVNTKVNSMKYLLTNQPLPDTASLPKKKEFTQAVNAELAMAKVKQHQKKYAYIIWTAILLITCVFGALMLKSITKPKKGNKP